MRQPSEATLSALYLWLAMRPGWVSAAEVGARLLELVGTRSKVKKTLAYLKAEGLLEYRREAGSWAGRYRRGPSSWSTVGPLPHLLT